MRLRTMTGTLQIPAVVGPDIPDTFMSVRLITIPGRLVLFYQDQAYIIPDTLLTSDINRYSVAQW